MHLSLKTKLLLIIPLIVLLADLFSFFFVFFNNKDIIALVFKLTPVFSVFALFDVFFAFVLVFYIISKYLQPLKKINLAAKKISNNDYSVRLEADHSSIEFDKLAAVFNKMVEDVKNNRENTAKQVEIQTKKILKHNKEMEEKQKAILNVLEDVEKEKNNAQILAADLSKFKLAVENASDHIIITDSDGIVLYVNKAAEKITGYSFEEVVGKKAGALWGGLMSKAFYANLWDTVLFKKESFHGEIKNHRKNGEKYDALIGVSPVLDEQNNVKFFVGIERDITREKEIDRAKTEFVSLASHQLRTPLSAIGWYTEIMLSDDADKLTKDQRDYLLEIAKGNKRMVNLVNSLLNVSRIEMGTFVIDTEDVSMLQIAKQSLDELKPMMEKKKMSLTRSFANDADMVKADPKLLKIIFDNLLSNAIKYTPSKGKIDFEIKKQGKEILIIVKDNGIGIPKFQQHMIFTKLFRADNAQTSDTDGTGLGLYIVKEILDEAGGKINFESEENKGSTFTVSLPETGMKKKEGKKSLYV